MTNSKTNPPTWPPVPPSGQALIQTQSASLFSIKDRNSRLGRLSFLAAFLYLLLSEVLYSLFIFISFVSNKDDATSNPLSTSSEVLTYFGLPFLIFIVYAAVFQIRRLHDLNRTGWWLLLLVIPNAIDGILSYFNVLGEGIISDSISEGASWISGLFFLYLCLAPGAKIANRFGRARVTPDSEKLWGWITIMCTAAIWIVPYLYPYIDPIASHPTDTQPVAPSNGTANPKSAKFHSPYPFTAQELWTKILKVTALPNGTLSKPLIEDAFGVVLPREPIPFMKTSYEAHAGDDWYFHLALSSISLFGYNLEMFHFGWRDASATFGATPPSGMCININEIKPSLLNQGWIVNQNESGTQLRPKIEYNKGKGGKNETNLRLFYDPATKCLRGLDVGHQY